MKALLDKKCEIICAQELRLKTNEDINEVKTLWNVGQDSADGVGVFFKKNVEILKVREIIPGRILMIDCIYIITKFIFFCDHFFIVIIINF